MEQELGEENWYERNFPTFIAAGHSLCDFVINIPSKLRPSFHRKPEIIFTRKEVPGKIQPPPGMTEEDKKIINFGMNLFLRNWERQEVEPIREAAKTSREMGEKLKNLEQILKGLKGKFDAHSRVFESRTYEEAIETAKKIIIETSQQSAIDFINTPEALDLAKKVFEETLRSPAFDKFVRRYNQRVDAHSEWDAKEHEKLETRFEETKAHFSTVAAEFQAAMEKSRKKDRITYISGVAALIAAASATVFLTYSNNSETKLKILASQEASKAELNQVYSMTKEAKDAAERSERKISGLGESITKNMEGISSSYQQIASSFEELKGNYKAQMEISKLNSEKLDSSFTILQESFKGLQITLKQNEFYAEQGRREALSNLDKLIESTDSISQSISESVEQTGLREGAYNENLQRILESTEDIRNYFLQIRRRLDEIGKLSPSTQPASQPSPEQDLEFFLAPPRIELYPSPQSQPALQPSPELKLEYQPAE